MGEAGKREPTVIVPATGRLMTSKQRELVRHALGLPNPNNRSYRRYFVTGEGCADHSEWLNLVVKGLATRRAGNALTGGDDLFHVTQAGAIAALNNDEHLCREDFPNAEASHDR